MVAWETAIGRICSASVLHNQGVLSLSIRLFSLIRGAINTQNISKIKKEFEIELFRRIDFPKKISRLTGIYFFESKEDAEVIVGREGWRSSRFNQKYLSKVHLIKGEVSRFDSEWITSNFASKDTGWIHSYFAGETYGVNPLTEVIASGVGEILNQKLKEQAFKYIARNYPDSLPLLILSRLAFTNRFLDAGQVVPFLQKQNDLVSGVHIINIKHIEKNSKFLELLENGVIKKPIIANWDGSWRYPDFSSMSFTTKMPFFLKLFEMSFTHMEVK